MIKQGSAQYAVNEIVVHCSATQASWMKTARTSAKVAEIRRWHIEDRGWRDIGYHYVIDRDGTVARGRSETVIGAGVEGHNRGVIHICLIGGHGSNANDRFEAHFTHEQEIALMKLIDDITRRTDIQRISGHNEHAAKACPGFSVTAFLQGIPAPRPAPRPTVRPTPRPAQPAARQPLPRIVTRIAGLFK